MRACELSERDDFCSSSAARLHHAGANRGARARAGRGVGGGQASTGRAEQELEQTRREAEAGGGEQRRSCLWLRMETSWSVAARRCGA